MGCFGSVFGQIRCRRISGLIVMLCALGLVVYYTLVFYYLN